MKYTTTAVAAAAALAAVGVVNAATATADASEVSATQQFGTQATLVTGSVVQGWTVSDLKPSSDVIPYRPNGTLWEATASDEAIQGNVVPCIFNLNARAANGETYPTLYQVATPQGVNPATLAQGDKTTGKVYFDVTGHAPNSVVYMSGGEDQLVFVPPPPAPAQGRTGGVGSSAPSAGGQTAPGSSDSQTAPASRGSQGTPLPPGSEGTPLPGGSQGTPLPGGSEGTPLPGGSEGTPPPESSQGTPLPGGSQGTPLPGGSEEIAPPAGGPAGSAPAAPESPAPAGPAAPGPQPANRPGPGPAGSQGTALSPGSP